MRALLSILALILAVGLALSAAGPAAAQPSPTIQLAVLLDGSVSVTNNDVDGWEWNTEINGLVAALEDPSCIPRDGSVELTVIQFGGDLTPGDPPSYNPGAIVHISRMHITDASVAATAAGIVNTTIRNSKIGGSSPLHLGIHEAIDEIGGDNAIDGAIQIINISTNGGTNRPAGLPRDLAEQARDAAIHPDIGIDEISAEGLGDIITTEFGEHNEEWLQGNITYPQPGTIAPPFIPGWVYLGAAQDDGIQNAAEFTEAIGQKIPRYTLTVNSSGGGSVAKDPNQATYTYGTNVQLTATADTGWTFSAWSGDLTGSTNPDNINMDSSKTVTANFSSESNGDGGGGCFIATAAYGSYLDSHVETLRNFRDSYMVSNPVGSALVSTYYKLSPPVADFIDDHPTLKPVVRAGLLPAVAMSTVALNTTSAEKVAIVGSLALVSVALAVWLSRRRGKGSRCEQPHQ